MAWAQLPCGMWDLPGPGFELMSPALAGRFLTPGPPGKSLSIFLTVGLSSFRLRMRSLSLKVAKVVHVISFFIFIFYFFKFLKIFY